MECLSAVRTSFCVRLIIKIVESMPFIHLLLAAELRGEAGQKGAQEGADHYAAGRTQVPDASTQKVVVLTLSNCLTFWRNVCTIIKLAFTFTGLAMLILPM